MPALVRRVHVPHGLRVLVVRIQLAIHRWITPSSSLSSLDSVARSYGGVPGPQQGVESGIEYDAAVGRGLDERQRDQLRLFHTMCGPSCFVSSSISSLPGLYMPQYPPSNPVFSRMRCAGWQAVYQKGGRSVLVGDLPHSVELCCRA